MRQRLDLRSAFLGIVFGVLVSTLVGKSRPKEHVAPWQLPTHPSEVYKQQLRQKIHQAVSEGWTLASQRPSHQATLHHNGQMGTTNDVSAKNKITRQL